MTFSQKLLVPLALVSALGGINSNKLAAQQPQPPINKEYELKAAIIGVLTEYVTWPQQAPAARLRVGVVGDYPFMEKNIDQLRLQGREKQFDVMEFKTMQEYKECHILFVPRKPEESLANRFQVVKDIMRKNSVPPLLVVGEANGLAADGATVNLVVRANRIHIQLNPEAAARANLKVNPRFLRYVEIVRGG